MRSTILYTFVLLSVLIVLVAGSVSEPTTKTQADSFDNDSDFSEKSPEIVKQEFTFALINGNVEEVKSSIEKYDYLTRKFNVDIFVGLLKCFNHKSKHETCMELFELLKPSFRDVSGSKSTPLIHAVIYNKMDIVNALLTMPEINVFIDKVDNFGRTALMYAAKLGSFYAVQHIIRISTASINLQDRFGKTALHYACEMNSLRDENSAPTLELPSWLTGVPNPDSNVKNEIFSMILLNGGNILPDGPEYKLTTSDSQISKIVTEKGGKVVIEYTAEDRIAKIVKFTLVSQLKRLLGLTHIYSAVEFVLISVLLANPFMMAINDLCYHIQQIILPGTDFNFVVTLDLGGDGLADFSFNILFVLLMALLVKKAMEPQPFKI